MPIIVKPTSSLSILVYIHIKRIPLKSVGVIYFKIQNPSIKSIDDPFIMNDIPASQTKRDYVVCIELTYLKKSKRYSGE